MKRSSEIFGKRIYTDKARYLGSIEDIVVDDKQGAIAGLVFGYKKGKALSVPFGSIMAIGDIVLIYSKKAGQAGA